MNKRPPDNSTSVLQTPRSVRGVFPHHGCCTARRHKGLPLQVSKMPRCELAGANTFPGTYNALNRSIKREGPLVT